MYCMYVYSTVHCEHINLHSANIVSYSLLIDDAM